MGLLIESDDISSDMLQIQRDHAFEKLDSITKNKIVDRINPNPLTKQSFNKFLDNNFILCGQIRGNNAVIIKNNLLSEVYRLINSNLDEMAKAKKFRDKAFPSDAEGRKRLVKCLETYKPSMDLGIKENIRQKINNYTKKLFNEFLDTKNLLTGKYPAELRLLDNGLYADLVPADERIIATNNSAVLYEAVINSLKLEALLEEDFSEFQERLKKNLTPPIESTSWELDEEMQEIIQLVKNNENIPDDKKEKAIDEIIMNARLGPTKEYKEILKKWISDQENNNK